MSYNTYRHEDELKATIQTLTHGTAARRMCHLHLGSEPLPNWEMIGDIITLCRSLIFPGFFGNDDVNAFSLEYRIGIECEQLKSALENQILAGLCIEQKTREGTSKPGMPPPPPAQRQQRAQRRRRVVRIVEAKAQPNKAITGEFKHGSI